MSGFVRIPSLCLLLASSPVSTGEPFSLLRSVSEPEDQWARTFDSKREDLTGGREKSAVLAQALDDSSEIYRNRDGDQIDRIKTSILLLLADMKEFDQEAVAPRAKEILKFTINPRLYAAAARVSARCTVAADLRSPLSRSLAENWGGDRVNLGSYYPCCGDASASTTPRQEAARALLALGGLNDEETVRLKRLATDPAQKAALQEIPSLPRLNPGAPAKPAFSWIPPSERKCPFPDDLEIRRPASPPTAMGALKGKPAVVLFVFTRCHNPLKCSASAFRIAALQSGLKAAGNSDTPRIIIGTYDPANDDTETLAAYFRERGAAAGELHYINADVEKTKSLLAALGAMISFNGDDVASHSAELFLLDSANRLAGTFRRGEWNASDLTAAIRRISGGE